MGNRCNKLKKPNAGFADYGSNTRIILWKNMKLLNQRLNFNPLEISPLHAFRYAPCVPVEMTLYSYEIIVFITFISRHFEQAPFGYVMRPEYHYQGR